MAGKAVSYAQDSGVTMSQLRLGASDQYCHSLFWNFSFPPHSSYDFQQRHQSPRTGKAFISSVRENIEGCISIQS